MRANLLIFGWVVFFWDNPWLQSKYFLEAGVQVGPVVNVKLEAVQLYRQSKKHRSAQQCA